MTVVFMAKIGDADPIAVVSSSSIILNEDGSYSFAYVFSCLTYTFFNLIILNNLAMRALMAPRSKRAEFRKNSEIIPTIPVLPQRDLTRTLRRKVGSSLSCGLPMRTVSRLLVILFLPHLPSLPFLSSTMNNLSTI
jgi:hypothetical protein